MKSAFLLLVFACLNFIAVAQNGISFQGIARDPQGNAIANQSVSVTFTIGSFTEAQDLQTDNFGIFSASIGSVETTAFNQLNFANINENLKVEVDGTVIYDNKFNAVPYAKAAENGVPPGCIMPFAGPENNVPAGWLLCNGQSVAKTGVYEKLYQAIGTGWGDDGGKFKIPDLRGVFLRGINNGRTDGYKDPDVMSRLTLNGGNSGDKVGSFQDDATSRPNAKFTTNTTGKHTHTVTDYYFQERSNDWLSGGSDSPGNGTGNNTSASRTTTEVGDHSHEITGGGDLETRPVNAGVNFIIKY